MTLRRATCHPGRLSRVSYGLCETCRTAKSKAKRPKASACAHTHLRDYAFGLCKTCYMHRPEAPRSKCHPKAPHFAKGLCAACYARQYYRAKNRIEYHRKRRGQL